jgi:hypothetical protein
MKVENAVIRKDAEMIARSKLDGLIMPWSEEFYTEFIKIGLRTHRAEFKKLGYNVYDSMDYEHMEEMPEKINFIFDPTSKDYRRYFTGDLHREPEIMLPGQPNENLTSIVIGKRPVWTPKGKDTPIEDSVYIYIESGAARVPTRIHAVKGNETVNIPILYSSINGHIQILVPKNLTYS